MRASGDPPWSQPDHDVVDSLQVWLRYCDTEALSDADTDTDADTAREALSDSTVTKRGP